MKNSRKKNIVFLILAAILAAAVLTGIFMHYDNGGKPSEQVIQDVNYDEEKTVSDEKNGETLSPETQEKEETAQKEDEGNNQVKENTANEENSAGNHPLPTDTENVKIKDTECMCTLSVRCDTILNCLDKVDDAKITLIPENGVILSEREVVFYEGETVFNLLQREMKKNKIHLEFVNTPVYKSAYIEGIANIYEFDAGELSGWMYRVNGWFPNYSCSRYSIREGDKIEFLYTCDLGADIGGGYASGESQKDE